MDLPELTVLGEITMYLYEACGETKWDE